MTMKILVSLGFLAACAAATAPPASAANVGNVCKSLSPDELQLFQTMARSDQVIGKSMKRISDLAALFGEDLMLQKQPVTIGLYITPEHGINWALLETFSKVLLSDCTVLRGGEDPNVKLRRAEEPRKYRLAQQLCGLADKDQKLATRRHPDFARKWVDFDDDTPIDIRGQVTRLRALIDEKTGEPVAPGVAAAACTSAVDAENLEDAVEDLFTCMHAFQFNLFEYDYRLGKYVMTEGYKVRPKPIPKVLSTELKDCISAYVEHKIEVNADGTLKAGQGKGDHVAPKKVRPPVPVPPAPVPRTGSGVAQPKPQAGKRGTPSGKPNGSGSTPKPPPERCLPGDPDDGGACSSDSCVSKMAYYGRYGHLRLPSTLTSKQVLNDYANEKSQYMLELSRHQSALLAQGYVVAAFQRRWDSPKAFNDNLRELLNACPNQSIRASLSESLQAEYLAETATDGAWDARYAEQHDMAESKGTMMIAAIERIKALRKLVTLLHYDFGADQVTTTKAPGWLSYLPVLHYFANADIAIDFGNLGNYQCNMFATMAGNDFVPHTSALITRADVAIHKLFADENFRKTAFCSPGGKCEYPGEFQMYMESTSNSAFGTPHDDVKLRYWCDMRHQAALSLLGLEQQLVTLYPALAHAEKKGGKAGAPLFDRLDSMKVTDTAKAATAYNEAERALPLIQDDLLAYLYRVCDDSAKGSADSVYMATLNHQFADGFEYCTPAIGKSPSGLDCETRKDFLACKMNDDAVEWRKVKELPQFYVQVALTTLDALFIYNVASGGIAKIFTPRGILTGGAIGVAFTGANYGVTYLLARYNEQNWDEYNRGAAGAVLEGIDSYTNAITAMAAARPKPKVGEFVTGFIYGAFLSGKKPKAEAEFQAGIVDAAEATAEGGVRFVPRKIAALKAWLAERSAEDPELPRRLMQKLGEKINSMNERDYMALFDGAEGKLAASKLRLALSVRLKRGAVKFAQALDRAKNEISLKRLRGEKISATEVMLEKAGIQSADLAAVADQLGPRELALLADAVEEAGLEGAGRPKLADVIRKLCGLALWCPALQNLKGCVL